MTAMNPLTGTLYLEALEVTRARGRCVSWSGEISAPANDRAGGISATVTVQTLNEYQIRLFALLDHAKRMATIWDDISVFLYEANPLYDRVGARPRNLIDLGIWDHPDVYDASYANSGKWGEARWATPGVMIEGELVTTDLPRINMGLEEFVEHSYYEQWTDGRRPSPYPAVPLGNPLSPYHPWNKQIYRHPRAATGGRNTPGPPRRAGIARWSRQAYGGCGLRPSPTRFRKLIHLYRRRHATNDSAQGIIARDDAGVESSEASTRSNATARAHSRRSIPALVCLNTAGRLRPDEEG